MSNQQEQDPGLPTAAELPEYFQTTYEFDYHAAASTYQQWKKSRLAGGPHCGIASRI
jgi:hypothetical protein